MCPNLIIEDVLSSHSGIIGPDYNKYRNHVYRVFLNCLEIDRCRENTDLYAIAAAFHDIGIWTNNTIDYLDPSIEQSRLYLQNTKNSALAAEVDEMIFWHHKIVSYKGPYKETVETFRRADWIDVSLGLITFGVDRQTLFRNRKLLPNAGFHWFLIKKIARNLVEHPLTPLPMFKG